MPKNTTTEKFAEILADLIADKHISLEKIGKEIGVSKATLSKYTNDEAEAPIGNLVKLANYFNVSADYLLGISEAKTNDKDLQFVCDYTGLSAEAIENLKKISLYPHLCSNDMIFLNAMKEREVYFQCKNDLLQSSAINHIISCMVYEKILYKNLLELKRKADSDEFKDDFETHNLTLKVKKWGNQHKINLFNAQDSLINFIKQYSQIEKLDESLYNTLVTIATTYTPFENEQKERDEFENRCKNYGLYFDSEGDELNGNDN